MYLFQRIVGVGTYVICLLCICYFIPRIKRTKATLCFYTCILGLMGFFFVPHPGADLTRTYPVLHLYSELSFDELITELSKSKTPMVIVYYHIIGKLGDDRLLPCITALITYGFAFRIIYSYYRKEKIKTTYLSFAVFFFMSRGLLMVTISNIRTMLAISLVAYGAYKVICEGCSLLKYLFYFIIASLLHTTALAASLLFFSFILFSGYKKRSKRKSIVGSMFLLLGAFYFGWTYIAASIDKGLDYLSYAIEHVGYYYIWEMILSLIVIFFTIYCVLRYKVILNGNINTYASGLNCKLFSQFLLYLSLVNLVLIFIEFNIGLRLSFLLTILDMPLILFLYRYSEHKGVYRRRLHFFVVLVSMIMLIIACTRGDLCSLKFYE